MRRQSVRSSDKFSVSDDDVNVTTLRRDEITAGGLVTGLQGPGGMGEYRNRTSVHPRYPRGGSRPDFGGSCWTLPLPLPPSFPLELGPLNTAKLPQRGLGRSLCGNRIFCILALKSDIRWHEIY